MRKIYIKLVGSNDRRWTERSSIIDQNAFKYGEELSIKGGKFSYVVRRVSALFSLL